MILQRLRTETRSCHDRIENNTVLKRLVLNTLTLPEYRRILETFYVFYRPLEERLFAYDDWTAELQMPLRKKTPLLERDLGRLGGGEKDLKNIPLCSELPRLEGPARRLGCLYVLEGSTLGGQFISKSLMKNLSLSPENGAAFFNGYGGETRAMWNALCAALEAAPESWGDEIVSSAVETFTKLEACFSAASIPAE